MKKTTTLSRMLLGGMAPAPIPQRYVRVHRVSDVALRRDLDAPCNQRVRRTLRLIEIERIVNASGVAGILAAEIGDLTGMPSSTVNDMLRSLLEERRIRRVDGSGARPSRYYGRAS